MLVLLLGASFAAADSGILLPRDKNQPDPKVLSLEEMEITVVIDNGDARVYLRQIFANHTGRYRGRGIHVRSAQPRDSKRLRRMGWAHAAFRR